MKVFISWSGERSRIVGQALKHWLPLILHFVKPWISVTDIDAGQRWATEIGQELSDSTFGILCLTSDNLQSPWILFEAGALAKSLVSGAVVPYLVGVDFSDITGPLAQFQAKKADESSTRDLVKAINNMSKEPVPAERIDELFSLAWPRLHESMTRVPPSTTIPEPARQVRDVLEELVKVVREVEQRTRILDGIFSAPAKAEVFSSPEPQITIPEWRVAAATELLSGNVNGAIKAVRKGIPTSLKEAKGLVQSWRPQINAALSLIRRGYRVKAIEIIRSVAGIGSKNAKQVVDSLFQQVDSDNS